MKYKRHRARSPEKQTEEEALSEAFSAIVDDKPIEPIPDESPPEEPPKEEPIQTESLDDYLRKQVYQDLYGTDSPTHYERTLLAIKSKL